MPVENSGEFALISEHIRTSTCPLLKERSTHRLNWSWKDSNLQPDHYERQARWGRLANHRRPFDPQQVRVPKELRLVMPCDLPGRFPLVDHGALPI
jgi:hypothetical protein